MFLHLGPFLPLRSSHWMLLHVLSLLLLLVRPSCYFSTTFYITCQGEHSKWKKFFSCCCGKCAPKKPEEDEDAPDLGDLTAEEETEVTKSAWKYKLLHKIGIEKVLMYLNVIRSPFYYTWSLSPCYTPHKWEGVSFLSLLVPYTLLHCCYTLLQACYTTITQPLHPVTPPLHSPWYNLLRPSTTCFTPVTPPTHPLHPITPPTHPCSISITPC